MRALVTGCSSGFGLETAIEFARRGHDVVASMRDLSNRDALDLAAGDAGVRVELVQLDVTDAASVTAATEAASRVGSIDIVVNNAGFQIWAPLEETTDDDVVQQFDTNVTGLVRVIRAVLPSMRAQGGGIIVNVSSVVGMTGSPFESLYSASKHAVEALSESLHFEVRPFGIRVVVIEPGGYPTAFARNAKIGARFDPERSPYAPGYRAWTEALSRTEGHAHGDPRRVACAIADAAESDNPRLYWPVGAEAELVDSLRRPVPFEDYEHSLRTTLGWWD